MSEPNRKPFEPAAGWQFLRALVEALGLGDRAVRRCVIDVSLDDVVKVYLEEITSVDRLTGLLGEIPRVNPYVRYVDRVQVDNAGGTAVEVKALNTQDSPERELALGLLRKWEGADAATREEIARFVYGQ